MKRVQVGVVMLSLVLDTGCRSTAAPSPTYLCSGSRRRCCAV